MEPYLGKLTTEVLIRQDLPFTTRIVVHLYDRLIQDCPATGHHIFIDRFYSGVELADELKKMGAHVTGTIMSNRKGLPDEVIDFFFTCLFCFLYCPTKFFFVVTGGRQGFAENGRQWGEGIPERRQSRPSVEGQASELVGDPTVARRFKNLWWYRVTRPKWAA